MNPVPEDLVDAEALFRLHAPFVARFLFRLGVHRQAIDDLVQDVFLVAHRDGGYRPGPASATTYLASIAVRLVANQRRRARTRSFLMRALWSRATDLGSAATPVQVIEANETMRKLTRALDLLSPEQRAVFVMAELEEIPCTEIAIALATPVGTVYWRLREARACFAREILRDEPPARASRAPKGVSP
jgi:RNA polymerase sigma-70 factor (ECF subfamily)